MWKYVLLVFLRLHIFYFLWKIQDCMGGSWEYKSKLNCWHIHVLIFFFFFPLGNRSTEECRCCFTRFKLHKQNKRFRCFHLHQVHSWSGNLATLPEVRGYFVLLSKVSEWSKLQMYLGWCIFGCIYRLGEESLDRKPCKEGFGGSDWWEAEYESVVCYGSKKGQLYSRVHQAPC